MNVPETKMMKKIFVFLFFNLILLSGFSQTYTNAAPITINDVAPANPFPSTINVSGATSSITTMTVTLNNVSHTWPNDVDVVLVSPANEGFSLMSDVGSGTDWLSVTLTIDDAAAAPFNATFNPTGSYRPTDFLQDAYPAIPFTINYPATAGIATFASVYGGDNANGAWRLYVLDDVGGDVGSIAGGWSITFAVPVPGCTAPAACNYNALAGVDDGSCDYSCYGCTYAAASNYSPAAYIDDGSCTFNVVADGCIDPTACNYCNLCQDDDGSCDYSCLGCTYSDAINFDATATIDDGSCQYEGCTDSTAFNFNPIATTDDGSCIFDNQCAGDINNDGLIGVADILAIIAYFGTTCN